MESTNQASTTAEQLRVQTGSVSATPSNSERTSVREANTSATLSGSMSRYESDEEMAEAEDDQEVKRARSIKTSCCHCGEEDAFDNDGLHQYCISCSHECCNYCAPYNGTESASEAVRYLYENEKLKKAKPYDYGHFVGPVTLSAQQALAIFQAIPGFGTISYNLRMEIMTRLFAPEHRKIQAIWNNGAEQWMYYSDELVNKTPFIITQLDAASQAEIRSFLNPAPTLGNAAPYPFFNYKVDTLVLNYGRCGSSELEHDKYEYAISTAVKNIIKSQELNPEQRKLRNIEVTYCCSSISFNVDVFIQQFIPILGLHSLTLTLHDHYPGLHTDHKRRFNDSYAMQNDAESGILIPGAYNFRVTVADCYGNEFFDLGENSYRNEDSEDSDDVSDAYGNEVSEDSDEEPDRDYNEVSDDSDEEL